MTASSRPRKRPERSRAVPFHAVSRTWDVAIVGAGYVGLPLAQTFADVGKRVLIVDVVPEIVDGINAGRSHIEDVRSELLAPHVSSGAITATIAAGSRAISTTKARCSSRPKGTPSGSSPAK